MLRYTGHPLYDVGVATITAFAGKRDPADLVESDLEAIATYMAREYVRQPLKSFLTVAFPNSGFTQPAFEKTPERRHAYAQSVLGAYGALPLDDETCIFTGEPAAAVIFKDRDDVPPGRAFRQHIPLLTGEGVINFHPYGDAGVPVSGTAMLALQALPLGSAKVGGRLLAVHSDNEEIIYHFAASFLEENRRLIQLAQAEGSTKMPEPRLSYRTLLIATLLNAQRMQREAVASEEPFSITAYHLTNSGQGADLSMYHLPSQVVSFLAEMFTAKYRGKWQTIVNRAWERPGRGAGEDFEPGRNYLYEDLFGLPDNARFFVRTYLLREAAQYARGRAQDPRGEYSLAEEAGMVSWDITERFLRRIMNVDKERIEQIRALGDRLAEYISSENDRGFFRGFFTEQRYPYFRNLLVKANLQSVRRGHPPLVTLEPYIQVFEEGDELAQADWRLARDLVLIRMVERLYEAGWLGQNRETLTELTTEAEATER
ncbi:MAG: type I-B CRISPR-associated protein Cas8b1/Cst1 [Anaerolineae bacterium]|nr:type I-B CRISPR-associated protein Cas8b1/Cst1 [Anaerolineae bacterium]